ncbi:7730_t:CDS:1, partial [Gigaspora rosea]
MSLYRTNKNKFYLRAAMHLGKGKTGEQVCNKLRRLITKYMDESSNKT